MSASRRQGKLYPADHWQHTVGQPPHAVTVFENPTRARTLYLIWRGKDPKGQPQNLYESLRTRLVLVDGKGKPLVGRALQAAYAPAITAAEKKYAELAGHAPAPAVATQAPDPADLDPTSAPAQQALTIAAGIAALTDPATGRYAARTGHNDDVRDALKDAERVWGPDTRWAAIRRDDYVRLWRAVMVRIRAKGFDGYAGAKACITRVLRAVDALRDAERIAEDAAPPPRKWVERLSRDFAELHGGGEIPDVKKPRYTVDELRALLAAAPQVDPRLGLAVALGAELRPVQVLRGRRSALTLPPLLAPLPEPGQDSDVDWGSYRVRGRGKKLGTLVDLTRGQRAAVDRALDPATGYLRALEARRLATATPETPGAYDYLLFPGFRLSDARSAATRAGQATPFAPSTDDAVTTPVHYESIRKWWRQAEAIGTVPQIKGRVWYGVRRGTVDAADELNISTGAVQQLGGWASAETPLRIYKDRENRRDQRAARDARAAIRGEPGAPPDTAEAAADAPVRADTSAPTTDVSEGTRRQNVGTSDAASTAPNDIPDKSREDNDL